MSRSWSNYDNNLTFSQLLIQPRIYASKRNTIHIKRIVFWKKNAYLLCSWDLDEKISTNLPAPIKSICLFPGNLRVKNLQEVIAPSENDPLVFARIENDSLHTDIRVVFIKKETMITPEGLQENT